MKSGTHQIGPENGSVTVSTYVGGMGSKMGHDLVLEATRWSGTVNIEENPLSSTADVTVDVRSLEVIQATGGLKPLSDKDKGDIAENQAKTLQSDKFPEITFVSTSLSGAAPALSLIGDLTIKGTTQPVALDVTVGDDGQVTARTTVQQTDFGIKPYSKMGALKVKDPVDIEVTFSLPTA